MGHILLRNPTILKPFLVIFASNCFWTIHFVNINNKKAFDSCNIDEQNEKIFKNCEI